MKDVNSVTDLNASQREFSLEDWLFTALLAMVLEHCGTMKKGELDSYRLKSNEEAMRLLAKAGLIEIEQEKDDRITARMLPAFEDFIRFIKNQ